jgi:hypothetical protein
MMFESILPVTSKCSKCGADSRGAPLCESCAKSVDSEALSHARDARVQAFLRDVPKSFRWSSKAALERQEGLNDDLALRVRSLPRPAILRVLAAPLNAAMMLLHGPSARGKTSCAIARARLLAGQGLRALFVTAAALAESARVAPFGARVPALDAARAADVLVLDELGGEPQALSNPVVTLLHDRHANESITIVTTGLTLEQLSARYNDGAVRRLVERGRSIKVSFEVEAAR